jgi:MinD superfamily P-loop ATPase
MTATEHAVRLAVASGKGGTGKTTVAVNLASILAEDGVPVQYLDCDVEEPNGHIFLKPQIESSEPIGIPVPVVDEGKCTGCGVCGDACAYHAIAVMKKPLLFPELCHGCGGCMLACPEEAIHEELRTIGVVETGRADGIGFAQGRLNVGEAMSPPLIRAVKRKAKSAAVVVMDAPPGTSCPVVATLRDADYVLLVTEPTPFGLHDLRLAVDTVRQLGLPFGVLINRWNLGDERVSDYCRDQEIPLLGALPDDRRAAEAYSRGELLTGLFPEFAENIRRLWSRLQEQVQMVSP